MPIETRDWNPCLMKPGSRILFSILFAALALQLAPGITGQRPASAARSVEWNRYDVHLDVQPDGAIDVSEYQEIEFTGGPFTTGFATIPLDRMDGIRDVRVSEAEDTGPDPYTFIDSDAYDGDPGTYTVVQSASEVYIDWGFEPTTDQTRTFVIEYRVFGAIRVYPGETPPNQQIWWTAISDEVTEIADIEVATVAIELPEPVDPAVVIAGSEGVELEPEITENQTWTWTFNDMDQGDDLTVRLQFPPITAATLRSWQQRDDQQREEEAEQEQRSAVLNLLFLAIAGLGAVGGGIGLYGLWYSRGRDPYAAEAGSFLAEPPGDLAPGAAGVLLDESANEQDLIATLLDLARRRVLTLEEEGNKGLFGSRDFKLTLGTVPEDLRPFEHEMLKAIFGPTLESGETASFSDIKTRFAAASDSIKDKLYDEVVSRGYFDVAPESTRKRWRSVASTGIVGIIIVAAIVISRFASDSPAIWLVVAVAILLVLAVIWLSNHMPRKTQKGAEAASKWEAFKRYLNDIEEYEELGQHTEIFDRYLPFATAFGIENSWVQKFANVNAPSPDWYGPSGGDGVPGYPRRGHTPGGRYGPVVIWGGGGWGGAPGGGGGGGLDMPNMPDLQGMSDSAGRSLASSSDGLFGMLESAGDMFSGFGSSGGRGGGFGGGVGGGGFSGGGFSGGSSGGGGRGFG